MIGASLIVFHHFNVNQLEGALHFQAHQGMDSDFASANLRYKFL
jgi:hypothetical protein